MGDRGRDRGTARSSQAATYRTWPPARPSGRVAGLFQALRSWVDKVHPTLAYYNEVEWGGHVAAWEEPDLFATELRAACRPLRP